MKISDVLKFMAVWLAFMAAIFFGFWQCGCAPVEVEDGYTIRGDGERLYFERETKK